MQVEILGYMDKASAVTENTVEVPKENNKLNAEPFKFKFLLESVIFSLLLSAWTFLMCFVGGGM